MPEQLRDRGYLEAGGEQGRRRGVPQHPVRPNTVTATLTDADRTILGVLAPYDRTSVDGSIRSIRGCFSDSLRARRAPLPLLLGQGRGRPEVAVGLSTLWSDDPAGVTSCSV